MGIQINGTNDTITTNDGTISIDGSTTLTGSLTGTTGTFSGDVGVAGTLTSEDKTNIDSVGLITARTGIKVGPITGVAATHYSDGSIRTSGIITATTFYGSGANLTSLPAQATIANNADNRVITGGSGVNLNGEANLTWNGTTLNVKRSADTYLRISGDRGNADNLHIGNIEFENTNNSQGVVAEIRAITGNSGTQNTKGQLVFYTDNGSSSHERLRITSDGHVGFNTTTATRQVEIYAEDNANRILNIKSNGTNGAFVAFLDINTTNDGTCRIGSTGGNNIAVRGATITLDNGTGTTRATINSSGHFVPGATNTYDIGSTSLRWRDVFTQDLQLSNEAKKDTGGNDVDGTWGDYTIQEGENDLFLINNRNGKKYTFLLKEVS